MKYKIMSPHKYLFNQTKDILIKHGTNFNELDELIMETNDISPLKMLIAVEECRILNDNFNNNIIFIDDWIKENNDTTSLLIKARKFLIKENFENINNVNISNVTEIDKDEFIDKFNMFLEIDAIMRISATNNRLYYFVVENKVIYGHLDANGDSMGDEEEFIYEE